jgi:hypothetical protein
LRPKQGWIEQRPWLWELVQEMLRTSVGDARKLRVCDARKVNSGVRPGG